MKTHFFNQTDEAAHPAETASDAYVRERRSARMGLGAEIITGAIVIALLLLVASTTDGTRPASAASHPAADGSLPH